MALIVCPYCAGTGSVSDLGVKLTGMERKIFDVVLRASHAGISIDDLIWRLYEDRIDGGPDDPRGVTRVRVHRMNKILSAVGLQVKATNRGSGAVYRVVAR